MKVDHRKLHTALKELVRIVPRNASMPVLETVHLTASNGMLTLTTTDLSRRLSRQIPAQGDLDVCVHAKMLTNIIKPERGTAGDVDICQDGDKVSLLADGMTSHLRPTPSTDFPAGPTPKENEPWSLAGMWPSAPLKDALSFVLPAASNDESRAHLCTVLFKDNDAVTTDGHRLHLAHLPAPIPQPLLLTALAAGTLNRLLAHGEQVILAQAGDILRAKVGNWQLDTRLSDRKFPPYNAVIPNKDSQPVHIRLQADLLSKAITRVSRLTKDKKLRVRVNGCITLTTWEAEQGAAEIEVPVLQSNHEGDDLHIGFDCPYLLHAIPKGINELQLGFGSPLEPLRMDLDNGKVAVVMPLRLS